MNPLLRTCVVVGGGVVAVALVAIAFHGVANGTSALVALAASTLTFAGLAWFLPAARE